MAAQTSWEAKIYGKECAPTIERKRNKGKELKEQVVVDKAKPVQVFQDLVKTHSVKMFA